MKFNKNPIAGLVVVFMFVALGLIGPIIARADGPVAPDLLSISTNNFVIFAKTGITNVPTSSITGNIGTSLDQANTAVALAGITCEEVTGSIYSFNSTAPLSCVLADSVLLTTTAATAATDLVTAYNDAATARIPVETDRLAGSIGGQTFLPGTYKWNSNVNIATNITLSGSATDVWLFQMTGNLTVGSKGTIPLGVKILLTGGALPSNVFWQVGGGVGATLGTYSTFNGTILSATQVIMQTGAVLNGRALAQTQVTLDQNSINPGTHLTLTKVVTNDNGGNAGVNDFNMTIGGVAATSGTKYTMSANTAYAINETQLTGYTFTSITGDAKCPTALGGTITLDEGDDITCTITNNDDIPSQLKSTINVVKVVINDDGGAKTIADFPLFVNGVSVVSGTTNIFPSNLTYIVTETADANYVQAFSGDCDSSGQINIIPGDNKVCVITNDDIPLSVSATSTPLIPPLIDVVKTPSPLALPAGPGAVVYTYTLSNIGTVPVTDITMVGDTCSPINLISGDFNSDAKLDINEIWTYHCSTTLSATDTNTVTATGWANGISAVDIASATVVVGVPVVPPLIHLVKKPNVFTLDAPGGEVTYTYTVTNPGTAPLSNVSIADDKCTGLPGRVLGHPGDINKNNLLESNEAWIFTCQSKLIKTTTNTGTAEGSADGLIARDFAIATVVVAASDQVLPKTPATVVPGLPSAGLAPLEENIILNIIIPTGILILALASLTIVIKKRII